MNAQTPAKRAKELGAKSLKTVAYKYGCTVDNLKHKFKKKPEQFDIIVIGVVEQIKQESESDEKN